VTPATSDGQRNNVYHVIRVTEFVGRSFIQSLILHHHCYTLRMGLLNYITFSTVLAAYSLQR